LAPTLSLLIFRLNSLKKMNPSMDLPIGSEVVEMEALVDLLTGRCAGAVNDDSVEDAVSKLLSRSRPCPTTTPTPPPAAATSLQSAIIQDMGNYDEEEDQVLATEMPSDYARDMHRRHLAENQGHPLHATSDDLQLALNNIPLGLIGARLMQTFGDGPNPQPDAVSACLQGTRQLLHMAIKDARALRRKMKLAYLRAKSQLTGRDHVKIYNKSKRNATVQPLADAVDQTVFAHGAVDTELQFQAVGGFHKISYDPPCGFDEEQLDKLFPEEMYGMFYVCDASNLFFRRILTAISAYRKWKSLHKAATESSDKKQVLKKQISSSGYISSIDTVTIPDQDANHDEDDAVVDESANIETDQQPHNWGGYLHGRLSQFDARTEKMKDDWYLRFSEVRRGSFLPHTCLNQEEKLWEKFRKQHQRKGRINHALTTWEALPAQHVQFLHWLGFQPRSALPLPNEATTHALAFLAYDFYGKIVEKAVLLRCLKDGESAQRNSTRDGRLILELQTNEQLSKEDIEAAMNDSTVASKPLYHATSSQLQNNEAAQLYFGPGFEGRIEEELDQYVHSYSQGFFCKKDSFRNFSSPSSSQFRSELF
jgi:hypothetical protein